MPQTATSACTYTTTIIHEATHEATPEEIAAAQAAAEKRKKAAERAKILLSSILTREQNEQPEKKNSFGLQVGDRLYCIRPGARVQRLNKETGKVESLFCIHPENGHALPDEDWAITQKLLLETNEQEFLQIANETKVA